MTRARRARRRTVERSAHAESRMTSRLLAAASAIGAAGVVERVQRGDVRLRKREVEDLRVLLDPPAVGRLCEHWDQALHAPAQEHLGWGTSERLRDPPYRGVAKMAAGAQRAVRLERDAEALALVEQPATVFERAELHLVDRGHHRRLGGEPIHLVR